MLYILYSYNVFIFDVLFIYSLFQQFNIEFISHRYYPWTDAETYEIQNILYNIYDIYYIYLMIRLSL